jgi:hypothetical protein
MRQQLNTSLDEIVQAELEPFVEHGIDEQLVQRAFDAPRLRKAHKGDDFIRIRSVDGRLFIAKRGFCLNYRHRAYLEGLLEIMRTSTLPDVDFVMSVNDNPPCEATRERLPIGTFSKRRGCESFVLPCWSMMHDMYRDRTSTYSYHKLRPTSPRIRGLSWGLGNGPTRKKALQRVVNRGLLVGLPLHITNQIYKDSSLWFDNRQKPGVANESHPCGYTHLAHMEGVAYSVSQPCSMRYMLLLEPSLSPPTVHARRTHAAARTADAPEERGAVRRTRGVGRQAVGDTAVSRVLVPFPRATRRAYGTRRLTRRAAVEGGYRSSGQDGGYAHSCHRQSGAPPIERAVVRPEAASRIRQAATLQAVVAVDGWFRWR